MRNRHHVHHLPPEVVAVWAERVRAARGGPSGPGGPFADAVRAGRGRGGPRGRESAPPPVEGLAGWLAGRLPSDWFTGPVELTADRDEVLVVGELPALDPVPVEDAERTAAERGRIARFREGTREERIGIAREVEERWGRAVAWGARLGSTREVFTTLSVPTMTRLRQPERLVLDTLVDAGVARSRSEALAWCVALVGEHTEEWLGQLRQALTEVERVRAAGPGAGPGAAAEGA